MRLLPVLFALMVCGTSWSQIVTHLDSIHRLPNDTVKFYLLLKESKSVRSSDPAIAKQTGEDALKLAEQINFLKGKFKAYDNLGIIHSNNAQFQECIIMYNKSFEVAERMNNRKLMLEARLRVPRVYYFMGAQAKSIQGYQSVMADLSIERGDEEMLARCWWQIADSYMRADEHSLAEENFIKAISYYSKKEDHDALMRINISLGELRKLQGAFDESLKYLTEALQILEAHPEINFRVHFIGYTELQIGETFLSKTDTTQAFDHFTRAITILKRDKLTGSVYPAVLTGLGHSYLYKKDYNSAIRHFEEAVQQFESIKYYRGVMLRAYKGLTVAYSKTGNFTKANATWKRLSVVQDSVNSKQQKKELDELKVKYQVSENEKQISQLESRQKFITLIVFLLSGIFLLSLSFAWVFLSKQKLKHHREKRELELISLRAQMNPHFIFNCLNSINQFILMANAEASSRYLTKFAKLIRLILDNSRHSFVLFDEEVNALRFYLELEALRYDDKFKFIINSDSQLSRKEIPSMIIQPFIENAVWHGVSLLNNEGLILVNFELKENYVICTVEDNGVGRKSDLKKPVTKNPNSKSDARGIRITQDRVAVMVKEGYKKAGVKIIDLKDSIGNSLGTKVKITLPVKPAQKTYTRETFRQTRSLNTAH